jgi:hypothetical protein
VLSNRSLAVIAMVLIAGAFGDGHLYNRPVISQSIYPINSPDTIEVKYNNMVVLALRKSDDQRWLVTAPFHAPAIDSRVALLLDSNYQTSRSYTPSELATSSAKSAAKATGNNAVQLFSDPVELRVNNNLFTLGAIEPVSQLRYVSAKTRVYLQADYVVPLLRSPKSTFTDLSVTESVDSVSMTVYSISTDDAANRQASSKAVAVSPGLRTNDNALKHQRSATLEQLAQWQNLEALAVVDAELLNQSPIARVTIEQARTQPVQLEISRFQELFALRPAQHKFAYLIGEEKADKLGICVYC